MTDKPYPADLYVGCPCFKCDQPFEEIVLGNGETIQQLTRMSVCPECGNKQCPGASDHNNHGKEWTLVEETHLAIPSTENIRNLFEAAYPDRGKDFDNWLIVHDAEVAAAAEQRGAEKALQDFKKFATRIMPSKVLRADVIADLEESLKRLSKDSYLIMGPLRADEMEGDE